MRVALISHPTTSPIEKIFRVQDESSVRQRMGTICQLRTAYCKPFKSQIKNLFAKSQNNCHHLNDIAQQLIEHAVQVPFSRNGRRRNCFCILRNNCEQYVIFLSWCMKVSILLPTRLLSYLIFISSINCYFHYH